MAFSSRDSEHTQTSVHSAGSVIQSVDGAGSPNFGSEIESRVADSLTSSVRGPGFVEPTSLHHSDISDSEGNPEIGDNTDPNLIKLTREIAIRQVDERVTTFEQFLRKLTIVRDLLVIPIVARDQFLTQQIETISSQMQGIHDKLIDEKRRFYEKIERRIQTVDLMNVEEIHHFLQLTRDAFMVCRKLEIFTGFMMAETRFAELSIDSGRRDRQTNKKRVEILAGDATQQLKLIEECIEAVRERGTIWENENRI